MSRKAKLIGDVISQKDLNKLIAEVGVIEPGFARKAGKGHKILFGMESRRAGKISSTSIDTVADSLDKKFGWLQRAGKATLRDKDLNKAIDLMIMSIGEPKGNYAKRYLNALIAWIRNPIMLRKFGSNSAETIKRKGFDRPMVDTLTFFKSIKSRFVKG
jgi:hypothetical protein